jgi:hypothetical protein
MKTEQELYEDWYSIEGWKYISNKNVGFKIWLALRKQD